MLPVVKTRVSSRPTNEARRENANARDRSYRDQLLKVGARLFAQHGVARVSVEQLVRGAGISRATFYGFFENKNELAAAVLAPVFESGLAAFSQLRNLAPDDAANRLIDVYLDLWHEHRDALLLSTNFDRAAFTYLEEQHNAFNAALKETLDKIDSGGLLRTDNVDLALGVIAKTAIPLLRVYKGSDELERLYRESMLALLIKD